ncbi:unnamed protein product [Nyctereutes procyonoides]|uniref:(raccoon dog) hypothetical protein n=1 Tax=Nyctereutes procyonoides TaxID=34880 RepID=A0A811XV79_NYCPR|nr:unnamed protein product [Nyctereutes procyonoides]
MLNGDHFFSRGFRHPHQCLGGWLKALMKGGGGHDAARALARVPKSLAVGRETGLSLGPVCCCRPLSRVGLSQYRAPGANGHLPSTPAEGKPLTPKNPPKQRPALSLPFLHQFGKRGFGGDLETKPPLSCSAFCPGASRDLCAGMLSGRENVRVAVISTLITEEFKTPVDRTLTPK